MEPHPRFPSAIDPFDILGCNTLPFPLTVGEDIALKYILRTAASDDQMYDRAYEAIVCMWARKIAGGGSAVVPFLMSMTPSTISNVDTVLVTLNGTDFQPGCKVYKNGFNNGNVTYISSTQLTTNIFYPEPHGVAIAVVNPGDLIGNNLTLTVNPHPNTPRISSISPIVAAMPNVNQTFIINGDNFLAGCVVTKSPTKPGLWDGMEYAATLISPTQLTTTINIGTASGSTAGPCTIRVKNKTANGHYLSYPVYVTLDSQPAGEF